MPEKDFSFVLIKVNASGSWANLVRCHVDQYDEVKAACDVLANAHRGSIRSGRDAAPCARRAPGCAPC